MKIVLFCLFASAGIFYCEAQEPKLVLPVGHTNDILSVEFSPDSKFILTTGNDSTARVWESASGKPLFSLAQPVSNACFSHDGKFIITLGNDNSARIWNAMDGVLQKTFDWRDPGQGGYQNEAYKIRLSADDRNVYIERDSLQVHAMATGKVKYTLDHSSAFSHHGKWIATYDYGGGRNNIVIWDAFTGDSLKRITSHGFLRFACFSKDDTKFFLAGESDSLVVYETSRWKPLYTINVNHSWYYHVIPAFSPAGNYISIFYPDSAVRVVNAADGKFMFEITGKFRSVNFSADEKYMVTQDDSGVIEIWARHAKRTGKPFAGRRPAFYQARIPGVSFDKSGKYIIESSVKSSGEYQFSSLIELVHIWDISTGNNIYDSDKDHDYGRVYKEDRDKVHANVCSSPDGRYIGITNGARLKILDVKRTRITGLPSVKLPAFSRISPDNRRIITVYTDSSAKISELTTGHILSNINNDLVRDAGFSKRSYAITISAKDSTAKKWNASDGTLLGSLNGGRRGFNSAVFSNDEKYILTSDYENIVIWNNSFEKPSPRLIIPSVNRFPHFTPDEKYILSTDRYNFPERFDAETGKPWPDSLPFIRDYMRRSGSPVPNPWNFLIGGKICFSHDGQYIAEILLPHRFGTAGEGIYIVNFSSGKIWKHFPNEKGYEVLDIAFSADDGHLVAACSDGTIKQWDISTGKRASTDLHYLFNAASFSSDCKYLVTSASDYTTKTWEAATGKLLYSQIAIDSADYLVIDTAGRFDGTAEARKLLYFTCGAEIIQLDQLKDQLWVPGLVERIMSGEAINNKTLADVNICGLTPVVEASEKNGDYLFTITPRRGGLGEISLYVNNIEVQKYRAEQITKTRAGYELRVTHQRLHTFFVPGTENQVSIKAFTAQNEISSRGTELIQNETDKQIIPASLYAVVIGVSDYKGTAIDLTYPDKDATDISNAIAASARKFLETDSNKHVFIYKLTTGKDHYGYPDKNSIKNVLNDIGKKAAPNDILLIFFAGHGVMDDQKKRFYFLTADASAITGGTGAGISTDELSEWMKPANIRAQKRILVFDACQSGQAIKEFVKAGKEKQNYLVARNDDRARQIKAIDKLNDKSGLFILAASASDQSAYEMARYSQGLLTYALLKAIKQRPDILEDGRFLNVSRWFNAAEKTVSELIKESGGRQDPQVVSTSNINIGIVDSSVRAKILLSQERPLFIAGNFQNSDTSIIDDDLELGKYVNEKLSDFSSQGTDISYMNETDADDAWSLIGRYVIKKDSLTVTIKVRQNKKIVCTFEISGDKNNLAGIAEHIVVETIRRIQATGAR